MSFEDARREGAADAVVLCLAHRLLRPMCTLADAGRALGLTESELAAAVDRFKAAARARAPRPANGGPRRGWICPNTDCEASLRSGHDVEACRRRSPLERMTKQVRALENRRSQRPDLYTAADEARLDQLKARRAELRRSVG